MVFFTAATLKVVLYMHMHRKSADEMKLEVNAAYGHVSAGQEVAGDEGVYYDTVTTHFTRQKILCTVYSVLVSY